MINDVLDEHQRLVLNLVMCIRLGQEHLYYRFDCRQRERRRLQPLHQVIDGGEYEHERHLVIWIQLRGGLRLLEALSHLLHELIIEEVNANSCLQLVKLKLLEKDVGLTIKR